MKRKVEKKKITFSISLDPEILNIINESIGNRSKFIQNCIIEEISKSSEIKDELIKKKIIL
jgi:metal-responsive CopG/Arc/MetJ family transcriptional regulator